MKKIVIIGGGASGLAAAIKAKTTDNEVIILERNEQLGKKILVTGNGKCNYWNTYQETTKYHSTNEELLTKIITTENINKVNDFFKDLGIVSKIKNGYCYPFSNQAQTIKNALVDEVKNKHIKVKFLYLVKEIKKENDKYLINNEILADKLIIATGGTSAPKTGSDGIGYILAKSLNEKIIKPLPSLVQLKTNAKYLKDWAGIRTDVSLKLYENNKFIKEETGEIQLTKYGVSGICIFNLSYYVARGLDNKKQEDIYINFLPFINNNQEDVINFLNNLNKSNKTIKELLDGILNYKLVNVIIGESKLTESTKYNDLTNNELTTLVKYLTNFKVNITETNSFEDAQVSSGGVSLSNLNLNTFESLTNKNLYFTGEVIDVTGDCGGYNLGFAWISGLTAGNSAKE